ncbi:MAG: MBL fold metallo-hydrolase [Acidimicrobiia bacterium]|nr:MBL fold metallo-hydrolase [Acidimicrobiia bacterium]
MELVVLGSGSPLPDPDRAGPATLVRAGGLDLLFDCGRGVLLRAAAAGTGPPALRAVLLTHLHSDHVTDFNDVFTMRWAMSPAPNPLTVIGPPGTGDFVDATAAMLAPDIGYRRAHHDDLDWDPPTEVTEATEGVVLDESGVRVVAAPTDHRPVQPTVGYRVEADGTTVAIAGDTVPCAGLDELCRDADVYVQTVIRRKLVEAVPVPRLQDILDYHSDTEDAGRTASKAGVRTLVLNHLVPAPSPGTEQEWIDEAAAHFDGEIVVAHDLLSITV